MLWAELHIYKDRPLEGKGRWYVERRDINNNEGNDKVMVPYRKEVDFNVWEHNKISKERGDRTL